LPVSLKVKAETMARERAKDGWTVELESIGSVQPDA
jgi:hypothetical protein